MDRPTVRRPGEYLQILSNFGVVAGLFFLGFQILQERELKQVDLIGVAWSDEQTRRIALMGEEPAQALAKLINSQELDDREVIVATAYFGSIRATWIRNSQMEKLGIFSDEWRRDYRLPSGIWANAIGIESIEVVFHEQHLYTEGLVELLRSEQARLKSEYEARDDA
jgi:hypothetical protein